jgi:hypothetical protein
MNATKLIAEARDFRDDSVARVQPPLASLPEPLPKNVTGIAKDVLTPEEIQITSYDVPELLQVIKDKVFSCETVTKAFLRRAALAQKLVRQLPSLFPLFRRPSKSRDRNSHSQTDKLHHGAPARACHRESKIPRLSRQTSGTLPWPPNLHQRASWNERLLYEWRLCSLGRQTPRRSLHYR